MKVINLAHPNAIYRIITFNDGEKHLKFNMEIDRKETYQIQTRISSLDDMFILLQCCDILRRHGVLFEIFISYLLTMRMDRVMNFDEAFSLDIIKNMLLSTKATKIAIFNCHSNRLMEEYPNLFINRIDLLTYRGKNIIFPDAGAFERYQNFIPSPCIIGHKKRNLENGRIEKLKLEICHEPNKDYPFCVVDDLCDAGGTFKLMAAELDKIDNTIPKELYVTHAVNKKGIEDLSKIYDKIYITNSYAEWEGVFPENVIVNKVI